jgi:transposase
MTIKQSNFLSNNYRLDLRDKISRNNKHLWIPPISKYKDINLNTCFDMKIINNHKCKRSNLQLIENNHKIDNHVTKCKKIFFKPSVRQAKIIQLWLDASTDMFNQTISYIKSVMDFNQIVELRKLSLLINKTNNSKSLHHKISILNKSISELQKKKQKLFELIKPNKVKSKIKSKLNINSYNLNLANYVTCKYKLIDLKIELNELKQQLESATNKYNKIYNQISEQTNYQKLRTYILKTKRNKIAKRYIFNGNKKSSIKIHTLDASIKTACASFKTGITNYIEGNSGLFKIRYWSKNRAKKVMEIEPSCIKDGMICKKVLGKLKTFECKSNKWIPVKLESDKAINLHYDSKTNIYSLFVPCKVKTIRNTAPKNSKIGIDPGIRTFMSCISDILAVKFGTKISNKISDLLKKIDNINENDDLDQEVKSKRCTRHYKRIVNMVDEMHWKVINNLTDNYKKIYIGILNMKDVVSNETSNISDMVKRVGSMMKHFQFRQRLMFKCKEKQVQCIEVNESYTSKTCSKCGSYKDDLGKAKKYDCNVCGISIDRDINASRCILLKNTI